MHYDYAHRSVAGLGGFVEDALSAAVKQIGDGKTRATAWNLFRFGTSDLSEAEIDKRVRDHNVTAPFDALFQGMKLFLYPFSIITAPKDMKTDEKEAVHAAVYQKWKDSWKQVAPKPPATPPSAADARREAIAEAKAKAKAAIIEKIMAQRNRGIADANAGTYSPPPAKPAPDYDTINYQVGWKSTGKPLPSGAAGAAAEGPSAPPPASSFPLIPVLAAVGVAAFLFLRKKG
jgi:hypothetical protein